MTSCLLFDFFGTLVEYEKDRSAHNLQASYAVFQDSLDTEQVSYEDYVDGWEKAFSALDSWTVDTGREYDMDQVAEKLCDIYAAKASKESINNLVELYIAEWMTLVTPIPGAAGIVQRLAANYQVALISNTHYPPMVDALLNEMGLSNVFGAVVLSVEVGYPKPDGRIFEEALTALSVGAEEAVYIGDSFEHDYKGATGVGMDCYLIGNHARVPRDRRLRSVLDLSIYFNTSRPG